MAKNVNAMSHNLFYDLTDHNLDEYSDFLLLTLSGVIAQELMLRDINRDEEID